MDKKQLLYTRFSPFSRKVLVLAYERGLIDCIELVATEVGTHVALDTTVHAGLAAHNPLIKIPVLIGEDGGALFDSRVICEYLDRLHDQTPVFPPDGPLRWQALKQQATGDGIVDAAILLRFESARPAPLVWPPWVASQTRRIVQALDLLERQAAALAAPLNIGHISIACALGYLDFRFGRLNWRNSRPALSSWFDGFAQRRSMQLTAPDGAAGNDPS